MNTLQNILTYHVFSIAIASILLSIIWWFGFYQKESSRSTNNISEFCTWFDLSHSHNALVTVHFWTKTYFFSCRKINVIDLTYLVVQYVFQYILHFFKIQRCPRCKKNLTNEVYTSELDFRFLKGIYVRNFSFMNYMSSAISIQKYYYSVFFFFHQNNIKKYFRLWVS